MDQLVAEDILTLMLRLSQITDREQIIASFVESFNNRLAPVSLKFEKETSPSEADDSIAVATASHRFGIIILNHKPETLPLETKNFIKQTVAMLAVILENNYRAYLLKNERENVSHLESKCSAEIIQTNMRLDAILRTIPDPVAVYDRRCRCTYLNPAFRETFGWSEAELTDPFEKLVPVEQREFTEQFYQSLNQSKNSVSIENQRITKDGKCLDMIVNSAAIVNQQGQRTGTVVIYTDVTERKRLADQLRQAQKMEALGTLAAGIALDINDMLGIIVGNTELAMDDLPVAHPVQEFLGEINSASLRGRDVIHQLLNFDYKTEHSKLSLNVAWAVKESMKNLRNKIPPTIDIRTKIDPDLGNILADPTQISEVIESICINASEAMQDSGGILEVTANRAFLDPATAGRCGLPVGNYFKMIFKDNGCGIDPAIRSRVFDPYFTTKPLNRGSGMGLALVHGIVKSHGGGVDLSSHLGKGTIVTVFLPLISEKRAHPATPSTTLATGKERILFVDDEVAILKLAQRILARLGYQVETQANPVKALELIKKNTDRYDLVIAARNMARMNVIQFVRNLNSITSKIPVIVSTGDFELSPSEKQLKKFVKEFISKPLERKQLAHTIRSVLDEF